MSPGRISRGQDGCHAAFFGVEDPGRAGNGTVFDARDLCDRSFRGEISLQDRKVALPVNGFVKGEHDILSGRGREGTSRSVSEIVFPVMVSASP